MQQFMMAMAGSATDQKAASCMEKERSAKSTWRRTLMRIMVMAVTLVGCQHTFG